jgi:hypothetical protein
VQLAQPDALVDEAWSRNGYQKPRNLSHEYRSAGGHMQEGSEADGPRAFNDPAGRTQGKLTDLNEVGK